MAVGAAVPEAKRGVERVRWGARGELPVFVHHAGPGPTAVITAAVHGDESVAFAAALAVDAWLPGVLRAGRVVVYPAVNPTGLMARSRGLPDGMADLNRHFPGDDRTDAGRLCAALWADLARRRPDLLLDLHADSACAIPYTLRDRAVSWAPSPAEVAHERAIAAATGWLVLQEYPREQYLSFGLERSLTGAARNRLRCPALTLEIGARRVVDPAAVAGAVAAVAGALGAVGLVEPPGAPPAPGPVWTRAAAPRLRHAGIFVPRVAPGCAFAGGAVLGQVHATSGALLEQVRADRAGVAVTWVEGGWLDAGATPGLIGWEASDG